MLLGSSHLAFVFAAAFVGDLPGTIVCAACSSLAPELTSELGIVTLGKYCYYDCSSFVSESTRICAGLLPNAMRPALDSGDALAVYIALSRPGRGS